MVTDQNDVWYFQNSTITVNVDFDDELLTHVGQLKYTHAYKSDLQLIIIIPLLLNEHNFKRKRMRKLIRIEKFLFRWKLPKIATSLLIYLYKEMQSERLQKPYKQRENSHGE